MGQRKQVCDGEACKLQSERKYQTERKEENDEFHNVLTDAKKKNKQTKKTTTKNKKPPHLCE